MRFHLRIRTCVRALALALAGVASPALAQEAPPAMEVQNDEISGDVLVNGVLFEAALGLDAGAITALVADCQSSLDVLVALPPELQDRINLVIVSLSGGDL